MGEIILVSVVLEAARDEAAKTETAASTRQPRGVVELAGRRQTACQRVAIITSLMQDTFGAYLERAR